MKIELKENEANFKPITVSFTIENKEELYMCTEIFGLRRTIPDVIPKEYKKECEKFLGNIWLLLNNI